MALLQRNVYSNNCNVKNSKKKMDCDGNLTVNRKHYTSYVKPVTYKKDMSSDSGESCATNINTSRESELNTFKQRLEHDGNNRHNKVLTSSSRQDKLSHSNSSIPFNSSQKFLGYDWIAALLENDTNLMSENESFFQDLNKFRKTFKEDCCKTTLTEEPLNLAEVEPQFVTDALSRSKFESYVVNDRLFTESLTGKKEGKIVSSNKGRKNGKVCLARVSIPQSIIQSPYKVRPHRRGSFDSCDSFALRDHCLMGWENSQPSMIPQARSLDLSSEVTGQKIPCTVTTLAEAEKFYTGREPNYHRELSTWKKCYLDTARNMPFPGTAHLKASGKDRCKQTTDELLNSTHLISYEMEKVRKEREMEKWNV